MGEILKITTKDKYRTTKTGFSKDSYTLYFSDYKKFGGIKVPTYVEAEWNLPTGDFKYGKFRITQVEFDNAARFK